MYLRCEITSIHVGCKRDEIETGYSLLLGTLEHVRLRIANMSIESIWKIIITGYCKFRL